MFDNHSIACNRIFTYILRFCQFISSVLLFIAATIHGKVFANGKFNTPPGLYAFVDIASIAGFLYVPVTSIFHKRILWDWPFDCGFAITFAVATFLMSREIPGACQIKSDLDNTNKFDWTSMAHADSCNRTKSIFAFALITSGLFGLSFFKGSPKGQSLYHCANARGKGGGIFARNGQGMNGGGYDAA